MWRKFVLLLAASVLASAVHASSIIPTFAADGSDCDLIAVPFVPFFIYLGAVLGGDAAAAGVTAAEFRVTGVDPAWFSTVTANPGAAIALGNPITTGCNIAFATCQSGAFVYLYSIQCIALAPIPGRYFQVVAPVVSPA